VASWKGDLIIPVNEFDSIPASRKRDSFPVAYGDSIPIQRINVVSIPNKPDRRDRPEKHNYLCLTPGSHLRSNNFQTRFAGLISSPRLLGLPKLLSEGGTSIQAVNHVSKETRKTK
jgi:hypothetical protein